MAQDVNRLITGVRARLRISVLLRELCRYATLSAVVAFLICALSKFIHPIAPWQFPVAIILTGILVGLVIGFRKGITPLDAAMVADLKGDTGEKISAYLLSSVKPSEFDVLLASNAQAAASILSPEKLVPYHFPRTARYILPLLVLLMGMFFVPEFKYSSQIEREKNILELSETAKTLQKAKTVLEEVARSDPQVEDLKNKIEALRVKLKRGEIDRKQALAEIAKLSDELESRLRKDYSRKAQLEKTTEGLAKNDETSGLADAMKIGDNKKIAEETAKIAKKLKKLSDEMKSEDTGIREAAQKKRDKLMNGLNQALDDASTRSGGETAKDLQKALDALDKLAGLKPGDSIPKELLDQLDKGMCKGLGKMLDGRNISEEDLKKMAKALQQMDKAKADALGEMSGFAMKLGGRNGVIPMRLGDDPALSSMDGGGDPESFSGGGSTNKAGRKFRMKEGVTSDQTGTIGANKATKFIQEYASKMTEVNAEMKKIDGKMLPGEGITAIETKGAPAAGKAVIGEFEEAILNLQAAAEDEVSTQNIPRKYREHVKKYFDSLRKP